MSDQDEAFGRFLQEALAPIDRPEDHGFAARLQALVAIEEELASRRWAIWRGLGHDLAAIAALGAAGAAVMAAPSMVGILTADRALVLAALILAFGMLVGLLARPKSRSSMKLGPTLLSAP